MDESIKKIIKEQFRALPDSVKKIITSTNIEEILNTLTESHPLENHQRIAIENEIMLVLLRFENFSSFATNIKHSAQISRERAERITKLINRAIIIPNQIVLSRKGTQKESHRPMPSNQATNNTLDAHNESVEKKENNYISSSVPQQSSPTEKDMFHKKLAGQVHIPKEEEKINLEKKEVKEKPKQDAPPIDPYREPID